ncbi:MAG: 50S ribosomal protein L13 [Nanoarchaeota archaeon]
MIIDATDLIVGRLATVAAKKALLGEKVDIVNCENAILSGDKVRLLESWKHKRSMGTYKGPLYGRLSDRIVRRIIRGMLPYKQPKGREAFKRIMCFRGVPTVLKDQKMIYIEDAHLSKLSTPKFLRVGELSKLIGGSRTSDSMKAGGE